MIILQFVVLSIALPRPGIILPVVREINLIKLKGTKAYNFK